MIGTICACASKRAIVVSLCAAPLFGAACSAPENERLGTSRAAGSTAFPNDQTAYDYFRAKGFTTIQAAGIVGNLDQESGIDPTIAQQGGGPGRGIAQWSAGGRWDTDQGDNLVAFAAQEGQSQDSLGVQLDFIVYELQSFPAYGLAKLEATTNVTDAATEFELDFEGCGVPSQCDVTARIGYAQAVLDAYGNDPVATDAGTSSDEASTASDAGASKDGGALGGGEGGAPVGPDAAPPITAGDGAAPGTPGAGTTDDAGGTAAAPANPGSASGCALATVRSAREVSSAWLTAIALVAGVTRRRRSSRRA
jgi:hypothetical protein